jgi:hypothetical protein
MKKNLIMKNEEDLTQKIHLKSTNWRVKIHFNILSFLDYGDSAIEYSELMIMRVEEEEGFISNEEE